MSSLPELFEKFDVADKDWKTAKKVVEDLYNKRSAVVKEIFMANDQKKNVKRKIGNEIHRLTIVARGESWFFRGLDKGEDK